MTEESFMLVSLKEDKAKKLAAVISNETCRKILDYLAKSEATESELSRALRIPASTVHYNVQHLVENKLVVAEEFHYSPKGKEVLHYKLSHKLIIIAPQEADAGFMEKLRSILPVGIITLAATFTIGYLASFHGGGTFGAQSKAMAESAVLSAAPEAADIAATAGNQAVGIVQQGSTLPLLYNIGLWFFIGAVFSLIIYFISEKIRKARAK
jgi:DNA-binding transcriptional ArsR family regulator